MIDDKRSNPRKLIIAIDGPAASGKSTTARLVAKELKYLYIDTGAMYRALTLKAIRFNKSFDNIMELVDLADHTKIELEQINDHHKVTLDNQDVTNEIRLPEVSAKVSLLSAIPEIREAMVTLQREMGKHGGVVLEGRDIGTVVFPDADVKIFLEASIAERATRRFKELKKQSVMTTIEEQIDKLSLRDRLDAERKHSPLMKADDAISIDTSDMAINDQVAAVLEIVYSLKNL